MKQVSFLIKPASSLCNLRCIYCFYMDVADNRDQDSYGIMKEETMHHLIDRALAMDVDQINFCFQGGEPTVAGLKYFQAFTAYVDEQNKAAKKITYAIQTNGILLDDEWIRFLKRHHFLVGVSLDGYIDNHDYFRKDAKEEGTFKRILENIEKLEKARVDYNILTVLTRQLAEKPGKLFNFYRRYHLRYVQLIPCLKSLEGDKFMDQFALTPRKFAEFYKVFFDRWYREYVEGNYISVTLFDNVIPMYKGIAPGQCGMLGRCHLQFVVEGDGSVYPCDFFVLDEYYCGNINENSMDEIIASNAAHEFLAYQKKTCKECENCQFWKMCYGNCRRLSVCYYDEEYCGYKEFLEYSYSRMLQIAARLQ